MFTVTGKVASRTRVVVGGLRVEIVDRNVGKDVRVAETVTDENGAFRAEFEVADLARRGKKLPDLQARVLSGTTLLGTSEVRYNASKRETLNIALMGQADLELPAEYAAMTGAVSTLFKGSLEDLRETDDRQDITYLANKTGWDARAIAMAALADQFSARTREQNAAAIPPPFFYALFRAGLPANEPAVYEIDAKTAEAIWQQAIEEGIIPAALEKNLSAAVKRWPRLASLRALNAPAVTGLSSLKEMLTLSLGNDPARHQQFAELETLHKGDRPRFWEAVGTAFGETAAARLRIDGQLGHLTLNNAALMRKLHTEAGEHGVVDAVTLVERGFYRPDKWQTLIGTDKIPPEIPGADPDEQRRRYADLLAAQVRLSFPTAVVAEMVKSGETPVAGAAKDQIHAFLKDQRGKFEIGMQPVERYVARANLNVAPDVIVGVKRIQRAYQITPSDTAMNALLTRRVDSAYAVTRYSKDEFVRSFRNDVGGEGAALLIYAKAQQVHNAVLNIALSYLTARTAPGIGVHSPPRILDPSPRGGGSTGADVIAYPTLEGLFGGMDYCGCDHCRSILSPAAYLVDLLHLCDRPSAGDGNPQAILLARRPDIQHLPLTCENTNAPIPYIDVVNETLEYFVANGLSLAGYEGHSSDGGATPEELLASPQFVSDAAYTALASAQFPLALPFHRSLEQLRRYFNRFDAPLSEVMDAFRKDDGLERTDPADFGWRDILMEELRLSRSAHRLFTDATLSLSALYGFADGTPDETVRDNLSGMKLFARRLGISYEDIIRILRTRFVNPHSELIPRIERLGMPFSTLKALKDGAITDAEFDALLPAGLDAVQYGGDIKGWVRDDDNYARIMRLITISNPTDEGDLCSADVLELRYANSDPTANRLRPLEFHRLIRFIRLWKTLGWTVEQTDEAITSLSPDLNDAADVGRLATGFLTLLPRLGIVGRILDALKLSPTRNLSPLLACFAPINTSGAASLYHRMFLGHSSARPALDGFTDDGYGSFLSDPTQRLMSHSEALRAAFLLADEELGEIIANLGFDATTPLTLHNISAIYRRGWLARTLNISVRELLLLIRLTGLDPFEMPDPPRPSILELIQLMRRLRGASLKPSHALYLVWNQDISGNSAPEEREILDFVRALRSDLAAIESEFALVDDPDGQIARARMALAYGNAATDLFFGLLGNTFVSTVTYSHPSPILEVPILAVAPGRVAYDDFRKRLSFAGVLTESTRDGLKAVASVTSEFRAAVDSLYDENARVVTPFFARYAELLPLYNAYVLSSEPPEAKRSTLLANFLPELRRRRKRQHALQLISAAMKTNVADASTLLDDAGVLHANGDTTLPALDDLTSIEAVGLSAQFFFRGTASGTADISSDAEASLAYSNSGDHRLPANAVPGEPISGVWSGYLEAPVSGFYNIHIDSDAGARVSLMLDGAAVSLARRGNVWSNDAPIPLQGGVLSAFSVTVETVNDNLTIRWDTAGRGLEIIPPRALYSATLADHLRTVYVRFLKAESLRTALKLTAPEMGHLLSHVDYRIDGQPWLNVLPVEGTPNEATSRGLLGAFDGLLDFARLKTDLSPADQRLLAVLQDPATASEGAEGELFSVTRWDRDSLDTLLTRFRIGVADLAHLGTFGRVHAAYTYLKKLRVTAGALLQAATNNPTAAGVGALQAALRARYDETDWLTVLRPINDEMRSLQRDGLVAYALHLMREREETSHIDTPDKLFEYFLMDVQMDPCMQTSRVRHAISSVQLFAERCLMNLESRVAPSSINATHWGWMKRYRVWEANRKVFLYPENWLEPELRDDQSPFFKETMGELLQSDITDDRATAALGNYLAKLDEVAKLQPCGMFCDEGEPGTNDDVVHVVACTAGANRKYFYRRSEPTGWTPWEQIRLDIEDNPVIPVVWKGRLFLFWLRIVTVAPPSSGAPPFPEGQPLATLESSDLRTEPPWVSVRAVLCWSEHYNGKWQATRTSDLREPVELGQFDPAADGAFNPSATLLSVYEEEDALVVRIESSVGNSAFLLYNAHSLPVPHTAALPPSIEGRRRISFRTSSETFRIQYRRRSPSLTRSVLRNPIDDRALGPCHYDLQNGWEAPFFYEDARHVFYVTPSERFVTPAVWDGYVIPDHARDEFNYLPPLILPIDPEIWSGARPMDPDRIGRFVSEDATIHKNLAMTDTIRFGDKEIGPAGVIIDPPPRS